MITLIIDLLNLSIVIHMTRLTLINIKLAYAIRKYNKLNSTISNFITGDDFSIVENNYDIFKKYINYLDTSTILISFIPRYQQVFSIKFKKAELLKTELKINYIRSLFNNIIPELLQEKRENILNELL